MRVRRQGLRLLLVSAQAVPAAWTDGYTICGRVPPLLPEHVLLMHLRRCDGLLLYCLDAAERSRLVRLCCRENRCICTLPTPEEILLQSTGPLRAWKPGLTLLQRMQKRSLDIVFSLTALLLLWPLMLLCAAAVKCCDGGEVLYRQKRLTEGGRVFTCLKFRSMIPDAEANGPQLAVPGDARITPVGAVLRRFRLDELPQLFNILHGDMSVVGPRPERPAFTVQYTVQEPAFPLRLQVRAGLTGLAQVRGRYDTPPAEKLRMDLTYIARYSIFRDVEIILLTARALLLRPHGGTLRPQPKEEPT
ncbi:MAG: sugar transferase [Oscillospiraceae bacterium]|nr:sugar transferase [Oscillospiraceae bacterium]